MHSRVRFANAAPPTLRRIFWPRPLERRRGAIIGTVVTATLLGSLLVSLWVGPVVGALVLLAVLYPRWRLALRLLPAALIAGSAVYVVWVQLLHDYASVFEWPTYFHAVRIPVWIALVLVAADALIAAVWRTDFDDPRPQTSVAPTAQGIDVRIEPLFTLNASRPALNAKRIGMEAANRNVSVVIPTYNTATFLSAAIESVLAQTHGVQEVIVIDDGSLDDPAGAVSGITDPRLRIVRTENRGVAEARNLGCELAAGDIVGFLDADDIWYPHKVERQLDVFAREPGTLAVGAQMHHIGRRDMAIGVTGVDELDDDAEESVRTAYLMPFAISSALVDRDAYRRWAASTQSSRTSAVSTTSTSSRVWPRSARFEPSASRWVRTASIPGRQLLAAIAPNVWARDFCTPRVGARGGRRSHLARVPRRPHPSDERMVRRHSHAPCIERRAPSPRTGTTSARPGVSARASCCVPDTPFAE